MSIRSTTLADLATVTAGLEKAAGVRLQATTCLVQYVLDPSQPNGGTSVIEEITVLTTPADFFDDQVRARLIRAAQQVLIGRGVWLGTILLLEHGNKELTQIPVKIQGSGKADRLVS